MIVRRKRSRKITPEERRRRRQAREDRRWLKDHPMIDSEAVRAGARKIYDAFMNGGDAPWLRKGW